MLIGGIDIGLLVGWIFMKAHRNFIKVADSRNPGTKVPLIMGWTGMRGVVSLAAALSIPVQLADGSAFPQRNLILFITFMVILTTLLLQGLTLPYLIRKIKLPAFDDYPPEEEADNFIRKELAKHALQHLTSNYSNKMKLSQVLQQLAAKWKGGNDENTESAMPSEIKKIYAGLLNQQRLWLLARNKTDLRLDEEIIRKHLRLIDLEEEKLKFL